MSARCTFADDRDLESPELAEHAAACSQCAEDLARRSRARRAWRWASLRDDATERSARERRLKSVGGVRRAQGQPVPWSLRATAFAVMIVATCWVMVWARAPRRGVPLADVGPVASAAHVETVPASTGTPAIAPADEVGLRVVAVDGGASDGSHHKLEVGRTLRSGDSIDVPSGGFVDVGYLVDTASWIGITGPAEADVREERSTALVVLHRGTAHATAGRGGSAIVATDAIWTRGEHAAWVVEATPERTRITTTQGHVDVASTGSGAPRVVSAGEEMAIETPQAASRSPVPNTTDTTDTANSWRAVEKALDEGDRDGAESSLRNIVSHERDPGPHARASLRLSELLLARGANDEARGRLETLALGGDPAMASDAVWLYVRSFPAAQGRAGAWARYLATSPPPPMAQIARVERARELLDGGDTAAARAIAQSLTGEALAPVAAEGLERLRARLEGTPGDAGSP